jgi:hypothetical protein
MPSGLSCCVIRAPVRSPQPTGPGFLFSRAGNSAVRFDHKSTLADGGSHHAQVLQSDNREAYARSGKKLDMGKSCVRFKRLEDLPLDVIGQVIARVSVAAYNGRIEKLLASKRARK